jgi:hypothetical protein
MKASNSLNSSIKELIAFIKYILASGEKDVALVLLVLHLTALIVWMTYATIKIVQNNAMAIETLRWILLLYTLALLSGTSFVWYLIL